MTSSAPIKCLAHFSTLSGDVTKGMTRAIASCIVRSSAIGAGCFILPIKAKYSERDWRNPLRAL
jgi:hypothetical protein